MNTRAGKNKRIALVLPPRDASLNVVEGSGLMPDDVREALLASLTGAPEVAEVSLCDLRKCHVRNGKVYEGDLCLSDFDLVHWYFVTHLPDSWTVTMLRALAQTTRVVPNPAGFLLGLDKFFAHTALRARGLPTADFCMFQSGAVNDIAAGLFGGGAVLLKPRLGAFGHGIHFARNARELIDVTQYAQSFAKDSLQVFCETFEENDLSRWISTTVINGKLAYGYRKRSEKFVDGWKVYDPVRAGGGVDFVDASMVEDVALDAAAALGCDIVGFDFIWSTKRQKYLIVDENTFPGMYPECFAQSGTGSWDRHFSRMILEKLS
jgi:ribosomal protein S6--L-glutamate ligase